MTRETENSLKPINRIEYFLDEIVNGSDNPYSPVFRVETFLAKIAGKSVTIPEPIFRIEKYLAKICGENVEIPQPIYRIEYWLAAKCGMEITTPDPVYRIEFWLEDWVNGGTPSQTLTVMGISPIVLENAIAHSMVSLTQYGKSVQASTPTPSAPVDIVCNNGALKWDSVNQRVYADGAPEVLTVSGKNLFYADGSETGYINSSGDRTGSSASSGWRASDYIPVLPSTQYYFDPNTTSGSTAKHAYFTADKTCIDYISSGAGVFTPPSNCAFMRFSYRDTSTDIQLEYGDTATDYEPYVSPQTVTDIPMLLSVGDITDEKDIISGGVTHRIGYHVFDGTETFSKSSAYGKAFLLNAAYAAWGADKTKAVLCTHFLGLPQKSSAQDDNTCFFNSTGHFYFRVTDNSDTDAFKAWLAAQYAAGTPVIVFFVLAEETTGQTTPRSLHTAQGTNVVSATAEVSDISLTAEYKGVV